MNERHAATHATSRLLIAVIVALALMVILGASSATAASPKACRVQNADTGRSYRGLQMAVHAAKPRQRLVVRGTCRGTTYVAKNLTIEGKWTRRHGVPTLDGNRRSRVLLVRPGVRLVIRKLAIQHGRAGRGAGIYNRGTLTLRDVVVRDCRAANGGGGIYNKGNLRLEGQSRVVRTGGIHGTGSQGVVNTGTLLLTGVSSIQGNSNVGIFNRGTARLTASSAIWGNAGGGAENHGTMVLGGYSSIHRNRATRGGGVVNFSPGARLVLNDGSRICENSASLEGGGVWNAYGRVELNGSSKICRNTTLGTGGGVWNDAFKRVALRMTGSSRIYQNAAQSGGGVFTWSPLRNATLIGLRCGGTLANVYANTPDDCFIE